MIGQKDEIPEFEAQNQDGETVRSEDIKHAIIYFYPKASTPGCTTEACDFSDNLKRFEQLDLAVYGVSTDTVEAQKEFHDNQNLEFDLLADPEGKLAEKFGVLDGEYAERTTFIIRDGKVEKVFRKVDPNGHVDELVEYLGDK